MDMKLDILNILDKSCEVADINKIARMLGTSEEEVASVIKGLEKDNIIVGYKTMINWEGTDKEIVDALIELKITPQRGEGFDKVAEKIYKYPQVKSLYLMSGGFDFTVIIENWSACFHFVGKMCLCKNQIKHNRCIEAYFNCIFKLPCHLRKLS